MRRVTREMVAGTFGIVLTAAGVLADMHMGAIGWGATIFAMATIGEMFQRIEFTGGNRIVMRKRREPPEPEEAQTRLPEAIEEMRGSETEPADIESAVEAKSGEAGEAWSKARLVLGERSLQMLLAHLDKPLFGCAARLFLYDRQVNRLVPAYRADDAEGEPLSWAPGKGVTGAAYLYDERVCAVGREACDGTWGLEAERQARYRDLTAVAAVPLHDRLGDVIGVLSLSSKLPVPHLTEEAGIDAHLLLAQMVSVCLMDLLGGAAEGYGVEGDG